MLQGAVSGAARDATLEGNAGNQTALDNAVKAQVLNVFKDATLEFKRKAYESFDRIGDPEVMVDSGNGILGDKGDYFEDLNNNRSCDDDVGTDGNGGAEDVVLYTVKMKYDRACFRSGRCWASRRETTLVATAVLRNQPYGANTSTSQIVYVTATDGGLTDAFQNDDYFRRGRPFGRSWRVSSAKPGRRSSSKWPLPCRCSSCLASARLEMAYLTLANTRISQIGLAAADNASRVAAGASLSLPQIRELDINEVFTGVEEQAEGLDFKKHGRVILSSLERNPEGGQWIHWQRCYGDLNATSSYGLEGTGKTGDRVQRAWAPRIAK